MNRQRFFFLAVLLTTAAKAVAVEGDALIIPPELNTFNPPRGSGSRYIDPAFGTEIIRVTDSIDMLGLTDVLLGGYFGNSEICYFNKDGSYFIATENVLVGGKPAIAAFLYSGLTGARIKMIGPPQSQPRIDPYWIRWALADRYKVGERYAGFDPNNSFYLYHNNEIRLYDVRNMSYALLRRFDEYSAIGPAGGEGDLSYDGRYWVLDGDGKELFVYDLIDNVKYPPSTFDPGSLGSKGSAVGVDYAAISPFGNYVIVAWGTDPGVGKRYAGIELYDKNWNFIRQLHPSIVHWAPGVDYNGDEVIYTVVTHDFPSFFAASGAKPGDLISIRLSDGRPRLLKSIPNWAHLTFSACSNLTDREFVYVAYQNRSEDPNRLWSPFWDEIIAVATDGSQRVRRFAHHRSHPVPGRIAKYYQPDAMVNRQGTRILYRSTYNTGVGDLYFFTTIEKKAEGDNVPPNVPLGLRQGATGFDFIELLWQPPAPAADGDTATRYRILRDGVLRVELYDTRFVDHGLTEASSYRYEVYAVDDAGNVGRSAAVLTAVTQADLTPPTVVEHGIVDFQTFFVRFSEKLDPASALDPAGYHFEPELAVRQIRLNDDTTGVFLAMAPPTLGVTYRLTIDRVTDASKNKNRVPAGTVCAFALMSGFFDDFESGLNPAWKLHTPSRWEIVEIDGNKMLFLNTSDFGDPSSKLLGEYAVISNSDRWGPDVTLSCLAKSNEDLISNRYADYAVLFGYRDELNYYYVQFQPQEVKFHRLENGVRTRYENAAVSLAFESVNRVFISIVGDSLRVTVDGRQVFSTQLPKGTVGLVGIGSYNDSVYFDNVNVGPSGQVDTQPPQPPRGLRIINEGRN